VQKEILWILLIALGVFLGMFAYQKYSVYRTQLAIQEFVETVSVAMQVQSATVQVIIRQQSGSRNLKLNRKEGQNSTEQPRVALTRTKELAAA